MIRRAKERVRKEKRVKSTKVIEKESNKKN